MISMTCRGIAAYGLAIALGIGALLASTAPSPAMQVTLYKQAVAETAADHDGIAAFYRARHFEPIWTTEDALGASRRSALLGVVGLADAHGLPAGRYDAEAILTLMEGAKSERDRGRIEVELSRIMVSFAQDLQTGILNPRRIDSNLVREVPRRPAEDILAEFAAAPEPTAFMRSLAPRSPEYSRLLREKLKLEHEIALGGWGARVPGGKLEPGAGGEAVVALRNRLIAMGYLDRTPTSTYDAAMTRAVSDFQSDHGLAVDGIAGSGTLDEINAAPERRLESILVAMERERWLPSDRGPRHVLVNLTDFTSRIVDRGEVTFQTRAVIGKHQEGRRTPEFSDVIEFMVVNPSWYVPRSIIVKEYLPLLRSNPGALGYLEIVDSRGRKANRGSGFSQYNARNFPFSMRQPPGPRNALGLVKFMFPNKYNIYLHDTPAKSLFARDVRAFSHGCIRLQDPFDFAYALLAVQEDDPKTHFQRILRTGSETRINLETPVPVHLIYRTAFTKARGGMQYRDDVYGRDAKIRNALRAAGVAFPEA